MNNRRWYPVSRLAPEQIKVLKHSMDPSMTVLLPGVETATAYGCKLVSYHRGGEDQSRVDLDLPVALAGRRGARVSESAFQVTCPSGSRHAETRILAKEPRPATTAVGTSRQGRVVIRHLVDSSIGRFRQLAQRLREA